MIRKLLPTVLLFLFGLVAAAEFSFGAARIQCFPNAADPSAYSNEKKYVDTLTTYSPWKTGKERMQKALGQLPADFKSINGSCGTSSSQWDACDFSYEAHKQGRASVVMAAVPQSGRAAELYGGIYLTNFPPDMSFVNIMAGDHYAADSNNLSKMDIVTRTFDPNNEVFQHLNRQGIDPSLDEAGNAARCQQVEGKMLVGPELKKLKKNGCRVELIYCGKIPSAPPQRKIARKPEAVAPLAKASTGPARASPPLAGARDAAPSRTPPVVSAKPVVKPGAAVPAAATPKPAVAPKPVVKPK